MNEETKVNLRSEITLDNHIYSLLNPAPLAAAFQTKLKIR